LTIITTKTEEQIKKNNYEELKILTEELDPTIVCLQETNVKPEQQTIFGGHEVSSKIVQAERAKHGVAILVKEGIKSDRLELKTKLNAVGKSRTRNPIKKRTKG
jgi:exonuclease III